jgi:hypothetical protein
MRFERENGKAGAQPNNNKNAHIQRLESTYLYRCFFLCFFFTYKYKKYIQTLYIIYTTKLKIYE